MSTSLGRYHILLPLFTNLLNFDVIMIQFAQLVILLSIVVYLKRHGDTNSRSFDSVFDFFYLFHELHYFEFEFQYFLFCRNLRIYRVYCTMAYGNLSQAAGFFRNYVSQFDHLITQVSQL